MLIDWLSPSICSSKLSAETFQKLVDVTGRILSINPDGTLEYETFRRENIRSDSHQITVSFGGRFQMMGSPARLFEDKDGLHDNVFGSADILENFNLMKSRVEEMLEIELPEYHEWNLTRLDLTENFFLDSYQDVKRVLNHFKQVESGRYQTATYNDTVMISKGNKVLSGKMYAKGKHLIKDFRKRYPEDMKLIQEDETLDNEIFRKLLDIAIRDKDYALIERMYIMRNRAEKMVNRLKYSQNILRVEGQWGYRYFGQDLNKIGKGYEMPKKHWYQLTKGDLQKMYDSFWESRFGKGLDIMDTKEIKQKFIESAIKNGYKEKMGIESFKTWSLIKALGTVNVYSKDNPDSILTKSTFYVHRKIAIGAGLTHADFQSGEVLPFSRKTIQFKAVNSWDEIMRLVA